MMRTCEYCGKPLEDHQQAYCSPQCEVLARAAITQEANKSNRAKRGYERAMQEKQCIDCGKTFLGGHRALRCAECKILARRESNAQAAKRRKRGETRKIGSIASCEVCGKPYTVAGSSQKMCADCAYQKMLANSREYYKRHAETAREKRREAYHEAAIKRYKERACPICGNTFIVSRAHQGYCSKECAAKAKEQKIHAGDPQKSVPDPIQDGSAFAARRTAAGFSRAALAQASGIAASTIFRYERGEKLLPHKIAALEKVLREHEDAHPDGGSNATDSCGNPLMLSALLVPLFWINRLKVMCAKLALSRSAYARRAVNAFLQNPETFCEAALPESTVQINLCLSIEQARKIDDMYNPIGVSRSAFIRRAIDLQLMRDEELFSAKKSR